MRIDAVFISLLIFHFFLMVSTLTLNDEFVRSNTYIVNITLISSKTSRQKLSCLGLCAKENTCSMTVISLKKHVRGHQSYDCKSYQIIEYGKMFNQPQMEIWCKDYGQSAPTSPCPSGFALVNAGCYHYSVSEELTWDAAKIYCEELVSGGGSQLADFGSLEVRV